MEICVEKILLVLVYRPARQQVSAFIDGMKVSGSNVFNFHNPEEVKLLTRLRLGLSHLFEHKFKYSFQDSLNPFWSCDKDIETFP